MPLPTPNAGEEKKDFIARCVTDSNIQAEGKTIEQRIAICHSIYEKSQDLKLQAVQVQKMDAEVVYVKITLTAENVVMEVYRHKVQEVYSLKRKILLLIR